jgi:hypothetical protein
MANEPTRGDQLATDAAPHFTAEPATEDVQAWQEIDTGRYMPRRIKGSCKGRALG